MVGSLFLSIFSFSCTAILHCFISDEDSGEDHGRTPKSLQPFIDHIDEKNKNSNSAKKEEVEMENKTGKGGNGSNDMS